MNKLIKSYSIVIILIYALTSCKSNNTSEATPEVSISSISPNYGTKETVVTISGSGFDATATNNTVLFNGKPAEIVEASTSILKVKSPIGAGTGIVEVTTSNDKKAAGPIFYHRWTAQVTTQTVQNLVLADLYRIATDTVGNIYVTNGTSKIWKITDIGQGSVLVDLGVNAQLAGLVVDSKGNIFVVNYSEHRIHKIVGNQASIFAGSVQGIKGATEGQGQAAKFSTPLDLAIDANDNLYVTDTDNNKIRKITSTGAVSSLFTSNEEICAINKRGNLYLATPNQVKEITVDNQLLNTIGTGINGFTDGPTNIAQFNGIGGIYAAPQGDLFISEYNNYRIRYFTQDGQVLTLAGSGTNTNKDGLGSSATFTLPQGLTMNNDGVLFIASGDKIRKITLE